MVLKFAAIVVTYWIIDYSLGTKMSDTFEQKCDKLINQINKQQSILDVILDNNTQLNVISNSQIQDITKISDSNKNLLHKLETREFEIAIVGLEKAGKSTFANALIENNVLPSAPERCTFTSTRLVNGMDKALIEFYTEDEFNTIFLSLLEEIEFPKIDDQTSYKTFVFQDFKSYFDSLEQKNSNLYKSHLGKTDEEIKDILEYRQKLILSGETKEFLGDELNTADFQSYIKGQKTTDGTDTSRPRSVKSLSIESSKLQQLKTAVIYDVPGFDSPTKIHIRQTADRLKQADAIILVTNVGRNPSIQGTSLSVINNNTDADGIALKDKLFVFGNQLDTANSKEQALSNKQILIKDVRKYGIGEEKRVFVGSALKHLVNKGIKTDDYSEHFPIEAGVAELRTGLINYYENERFDILSRKIDKNQKLLASIFEEVLKEATHSIQVNFSEDSEKARITRNAYNLIEASIEDKLNCLKIDLKNEVYKEQVFSNKFKSRVDSTEYFGPITEYDIEQAQINADDSITQDIPIQRMNHNLRKNLHSQFLQEFSQLIKTLTDERTKDIEIRILRAFTQAVTQDDRTSGIYEHVESECRSLIRNITHDIAHNDDRFDYLIERFSRDVFDILIAYPLGSPDRQDKFDKAKQEFFYLDHFYGKEHTSGDLVNLILTQEKSSIVDQFKNVVTIINRVDRLAGNITNTRGQLEELKELKKYFTTYQVNTSITGIDVPEIIKDIKISNTKEELLKEINTDIESLRSILAIAVVPAINLELAFLNGVDKQIKRLIAAKQDTGTKYSAIFDQFISDIVPITKKVEFDNINEQIERHELKLKLVEQMKSYVAG